MLTREKLNYKRHLVHTTYKAQDIVLMLVNNARLSNHDNA